jgi:hypothetical protein
VGGVQMICNTSNLIRSDYTVYIEPELATRSQEAAQKIGCRTRSKFIRYAVINQLVREGFQLSDKFKPFADKILNKGVTQRT